MLNEKERQPVPPVPARREPAAETEAVIEARAVGQWLGASDAPVDVIAAQERVADALVRRQEAREHWEGRADYWREQALEVLSTLRQANDNTERAEARLRVAHTFIPGDKRAAYEEACALAEEALSLHRGSHDA